jgi:hypothetical protein
VTAAAIISAGLRDCSNPLWAAVIRTDAIQNEHTERHWFSLSEVLSTVTFRQELDIGVRWQSYAITLIVAAKLEVWLPVLEHAYRSRDPREFDGDFDELPKTQLLYIGYAVLLSIPAIDFVTKFPALLWASLTGATLNAQFDRVFSPAQILYILLQIRKHQANEWCQVNVSFGSRISTHIKPLPKKTTVVVTLGCQLCFSASVALPHVTKHSWMFPSAQNRPMTRFLLPCF